METFCPLPFSCLFTIYVWAAGASLFVGHTFLPPTFFALALPLKPPGVIIFEHASSPRLERVRTCLGYGVNCGLSWNRGEVPAFFVLEVYPLGSRNAWAFFYRCFSVPSIPLCPHVEVTSCFMTRRQLVLAVGKVTFTLLCTFFSLLERNVYSTPPQEFSRG